MKVTFILLSTVASFFLSAANALDAKKIKADLMKGQIIPDALDDFEPTADMSITYGKDIVLQNGDALQYELTMKAPRITFTPKKDTEYTLAMINLDSKASQIIHWMTSNIHDENLKSGDQIATYRGPNIPAGSSNHRVVYALFEQAGIAAAIPALTDRKFFDLKTFASENNLKLANAAYFYAQPRQYADSAQQKIKQEGILGGLINDIDGLVDDLGDIVGINLGGDDDDDDDDDDFFGDDDFFDDDYDKDDKNGGGLHIGIDLDDGLHVGVGRGRDDKVSSVVRSSGKPTSVARSSASPRPTKSASRSSNKSKSHRRVSSSRHIHYSYSSHRSSHSGPAPTSN